MRRLHLFEFEDQTWFPAGIRHFMTDFLDLLGNSTEHLYTTFIPKLRAALRTAETDEIVDLCSGSAGPVLMISRLLEREGSPVTVYLTDLYPNVERFRALGEANDRLRCVEEPVDARAVPASLSGFRLLSNSFHHFRPEDARAILADAAAKRQGIAVLEFVGRTFPASIGAALTPLTVWLVTPHIRPFKWSRLLWTYLIPLVPLCTLWDGLVSCRRVYTPEEMRQLTAEIPAEGYKWEMGTLPIGVGPPATYLIGCPVEAGVRASSEVTATGC